MWMNMSRRHRNGPTGVTKTRHGEWKHPTQFAALCPDGVVRKTDWLAEQADTAFSWFCTMRIRNTNIKGYITTEKIEEKVEHVFRPLVSSAQTSVNATTIVEHWRKKGWLETWSMTRRTS